MISMEKWKEHWSKLKIINRIVNTLEGRNNTKNYVNRVKNRMHLWKFFLTVSLYFVLNRSPSWNFVQFYTACFKNNWDKLHQVQRKELKEWSKVRYKVCEEKMNENAKHVYPWKEAGGRVERHSSNKIMQKTCPLSFQSTGYKIIDWNYWI